MMYVTEDIGEQVGETKIVGVLGIATACAIQSPARPNPTMPMTAKTTAIITNIMAATIAIAKAFSQPQSKKC